MSSRVSLQSMSNEQALPWLAALLGALLAAWVIFHSHGVLNLDGMLYVEAARLLEAGQCCPSDVRVPWVLYPTLIALIHKISGLGYQSSAYLLNILLFAITSGGLLTLVREAGGNRRVMLAAGALLFASPYLVGKVLPMVVRDHGFWAAHVWSLVFFLRFCRRGAWLDVLGWGIAAILALLFRSEGITYLLLLPLAVLVMNDASWRSRLKSLVKINSLLLLGAVCVLAAMLANPALSLKKLGGLGEPLRAFQRLLVQVSHGLDAKADMFAGSVLGEYLADYAASGIVLTLAYALILKLISSAGWIQLGLAIHAIRVRLTAALPRHGRFFAWLLLLGVLNAGVLIVSFFLLPKRYLMSTATVILLYAAFGLIALLDSWRSKPGLPFRRNWIYPVAIALLAIQFVLILWPDNPKSAYEIDAARWIQSRGVAVSRVYFDSGRLKYYATGDSSSRKIRRWEEIQRDFSTTSMRQYDYMLVHVSRKTPEKEKFLVRQAGAQPVAQFDNGRGDKVLIFRARHQE